MKDNEKSKILIKGIMKLRRTLCKKMQQHNESGLPEQDNIIINQGITFAYLSLDIILIGAGLSPNVHNIIKEAVKRSNEYINNIKIRRME